MKLSCLLTDKEEFLTNLKTLRISFLPNNILYEFELSWIFLSPTIIFTNKAINQTKLEKIYQYHLRKVIYKPSKKTHPKQKFWDNSFLYYSDFYYW